MRRADGWRPWLGAPFRLGDFSPTGAMSRRRRELRPLAVVALYLAGTEARRALAARAIGLTGRRSDVDRWLRLAVHEQFALPPKLRRKLSDAKTALKQTEDALPAHRPAPREEWDQYESAEWAFLRVAASVRQKVPDRLLTLRELATSEGISDLRDLRDQLAQGRVLMAHLHEGDPLLQAAGELLRLLERWNWGQVPPAEASLDECRKLVKLLQAAGLSGDQIARRFPDLVRVADLLRRPASDSLARAAKRPAPVRKTTARGARDSTEATR